MENICTSEVSEITSQNNSILSKAFMETVLNLAQISELLYNVGMLGKLMYLPHMNRSEIIFPTWISVLEDLLLASSNVRMSN